MTDAQMTTDRSAGQDAHTASDRPTPQLRDRASQMAVEVLRAEWDIAHGDFASARDACEHARLLAILVPDAPAAGAAHKAFGVVNRESGEFDRARGHFDEALAIGTARHDLPLLADTSRELAELYRRQGRHRDALASLSHAECLLLQLRSRRELIELARRASPLEAEYLAVARGWGTSTECDDQYSQGHSARVAEVASRLAEAEGMSGQELFWFRIGALLHDVGKVVLPAELLNKPGRLTAEEWAVMHTHPAAGVEMLSDVALPWDITPIVGSHHERWDGTGYPHRLSGEDIPRVARIVCIADVYDALTSERCYKAAMSHGEAMAVMRADSGHQFDARLFARFEEVAAVHAAGWARLPGD